MINHHFFQKKHTCVLKSYRFKLRKYSAVSKYINTWKYFSLFLFINLNRHNKFKSLLFKKKCFCFFIFLRQVIDYLDKIDRQSLYFCFSFLSLFTNYLS